MPHRSLIICLALAFVARAGSAQTAADSAAVPLAIPVASPEEDYLRSLQALGRIGVTPWSVRPLATTTLERMGAGNVAWFGSAAVAAPQRIAGLRVAVVPLAVESRINTGFPYGLNDGPVWAGKGLTTAASGGFAAEWSSRWVGMSLTVAPVVFRAQNAEFELRENGRTGEEAFGHALFPTALDMPQRFGDAAYQRVDPGESALRVRVGGFAFGLGSNAQWWGPTTTFPYVLGNNAGGFPHAFLGTAHPLDVGIGTLAMRATYARLEGSPYAAEDTLRFAPGLTVAFAPRGLTGLELGASRFYHTPWPAGGLSLSDIGKPFEAALKNRLPDRNPDNPEHPGDNPEDNQVASVFARWVVPRAGFEVYGEYGREDHNWNTRDLLLEPDHIAAYTLGARRSWGDSVISAVTVEVNSMGGNTLIRHRGGASAYLHAGYGHTYRGQLLGSGYGGGAGSAATLHYQRFAPGGYTALRWLFATPLQRRPAASVDPATPDDGATTAQHAVMLRHDRPVGAIVIGIEVGGVLELNRNLVAGDDAINGVVAVRGRWSPSGPRG